MKPLPEPARRLAEGHHSLLSRRQLHDLGCADATVDRWVRAGMLRRTSRGIYRVAGAARQPLEVLSAALARAGAGARIGDAWACGLHQLEGFDLTGRSSVIIPPRRRVRGVDFDVLHSSVPRVDRCTVLGLPTVTAARALIGIARTASPKAVRVAYDSARRRGLVRLDRLAQRAEALGRTPGAAQMRALIHSGALDMEGEGERRLDRIWLPGDPRLVPQVWVTRRIRLDFAFLDSRLALEHDDRSHELRRSADYQRDLTLAELDIQTLRIDAALLSEPAQARQRILQVHRRRLALALPPLLPLSFPR